MYVTPEFLKNCLILEAHKTAQGFRGLAGKLTVLDAKERHTRTLQVVPLIWGVAQRFGLHSMNPRVHRLRPVGRGVVEIVSPFLFAGYEFCEWVSGGAGATLHLVPTEGSVERRAMPLRRVAARSSSQRDVACLG